MKIAITNAVLSNSGDAAICEGIIAALINSRVCTQDDITVFDANSAVSRRLFPQWTVVQQLAYPTARRSRITKRIARFLRAAAISSLTISPTIARRVGRLPISAECVRSIAALSDAAVVISSGGTYLVDHYDFRQRAQEIAFAKRLGAEVVLWTQSMGPFKTRRANSTARRIAQNVDSVYLRDERSADSWLAVAPGTKCTVVSDAAFALFGSVRISTSLPRNDVILSVREWTRRVDGEVADLSQYEESFRETAIYLRTHGHNPIALSTCQGVPGYNVDDSATARRIFNGVEVEIDTSHHTPVELMDRLSGTSGLVSTRMHLAIMALLTKCPVVAIAYEFKTIELFENIGLAHAVRKIEDVTPEWLLDRTDQMLQNPEAFVLSDDQLKVLSESAQLPGRELLLS